MFRQLQTSGCTHRIFLDKNEIENAFNVENLSFALSIKVEKNSSNKNKRFYNLLDCSIATFF